MSGLTNNNGQYTTNNITIDSSAIETVLTGITAAKTALGEIQSKLSSSFSFLTNAGLFEKCLASLQQEASNISATYDTMYSTIRTHLDELAALENDIKRIGQDYMSYYDDNSSGVTGSNVYGADSTMANTMTGKPINIFGKNKATSDVDINSISNIISFMCIAKDEDKSLTDLLFDEENADYCSTMLQKFFNLYGDSKVEFDPQDSKEIQHVLLETVLNTEEELPPNLTEFSILHFKEYLGSIAKNNNTTTYDFVTNSSYKDQLKESLKNLYNEEVDSSVFNEDYCLEFKAFVNMKAEKENKTVEEVLEDINNLL